MKIDQSVDDFELPDQDGNMRKLSNFLDHRRVVLFFYPAAMTRGCTAESCHFRDLKMDFDAVGATRIGISGDSVAQQKMFSDRFSFDYPLLCDVDGEVAHSFGVKRRFGPLSLKRHTFVIDRDRTLLKEITSEFQMNVHADRALEFLRGL